MTVIELSSLKKPFCHFYKSPIHSLEKKAITLHLKLSVAIGVAHFFENRGVEQWDTGLSKGNIT